MNKDYCPIARTDEVLSTKVGDESVVFNTVTNKASCLDALTTSVWSACDGKSNVSMLLDSVIRSGHIDATEQVIRMAIEQMANADLLVEPVDIPLLSENGMNRRKVLSMFRAGTMTALPMVASLSIQPALAQVSCAPIGGSCFSDGDCCGGGTEATECEGGTCQPD